LFKIYIMIEILGKEIPHEMDELTIQQFEGITDIHSNSELDNVEKHLEVFKFMGVPDEIEDCDFEVFKEYINKFNSAKVPSSILLKSFEADGYTYQAYEKDFRLTAQVTDVEYYNTLVKNEQVGFSIEGFLGMKLSKHLNKYNMNFPDGEHTIEDKIYVVKDGKVVEIKDVVKEEMADEATTEEEVVKEEVACAETSVEEEVTADVTSETPVEEEMAIDPAMDTEAILAIVKPLVEEQVNAVIGMIADLKNQMEEMLIKEEEVEDMNMAKEAKMSAFDKFKAFRAFSK